METGYRILTEGDLQTLDQAQQTEYGAVGLTRDGRRFRYVQFGGTSTINPGLVVVAAAQDTNSTGLALASTNTTAQLSAGSYSVQVTNGATAVTLNQFAGGYLEVLGSGAVQSYYIDGNTAAAASGTITVQLRHPLYNAAALVVGTNTVSLSRPFTAVNTSLTASQPIGVTIVSVPNTATVTNWGWVQTSGHALVSATSATKGVAITQDTGGTAGFVMSVAAATSYAIGIAKESAASSTAQVDLNIAS